MRLGLLIPCVGLLALSAGCGGGGAKPTPVEGSVSFASGKVKADNLLLQFVPAGGGTAKGGSAVSDAAGKFAVKGDDGQPGLAPGTYVVTVIDNNLNVEDEPGTKGAKKLPPNRVALKYQSADEKQNSLKLTVEAGKTGGYDLKLD